jgi:hypothetical protein
MRVLYYIREQDMHCFLNVASPTQRDAILHIEISNTELLLLLHTNQNTMQQRVSVFLEDIVIQFSRSKILALYYLSNMSEAET